MKKLSPQLIGIFFTMLIVSLFIDIQTNSPDVMFAGITSSLDEIKNLFTGINNFMSKIVSVTSMIGFSTFVLFILVLIFSAGLSVVGIPKGKWSFLISLILSDTIWIIFKESFNPPSMEYLFTLLKANIILLVPFIIFILIKNFFPALFTKLKSRTRKKSVVKLSEDFQVTSLDFQKSLLQDIHRSKSDKKVALSPDTIEYSKKLSSILSEIDGDSSDS